MVSDRITKNKYLDLFSFQFLDMQILPKASLKNKQTKTLFFLIES